MPNNINDLYLLAQIVAAGSLTKAALNLDSSPPAISRRLAAMEARLGVHLIDRNARHFQVTEEGGILLERAQRILAEIEEAEAEASNHANHLSGRLRVGAMQQLGRQRLAPVVAQFSEIHSRLQVELLLSDDEMDLVEDDLDILFQMNEPSSPHVVARKMTSSRHILCASPDYLRRHGRPQKPNDLLSHDCLCLKRGHRILKRWRLMENGVSREIQVNPRLTSNSGDVLHNWVLEGYGIAQKFQWDTQDDLDSGRLVECLPEFKDKALDLYAVYAYRRYQPPKISKFLNYVSEHVRKVVHADAVTTAEQ